MMHTIPVFSRVAGVVAITILSLGGCQLADMAQFSYANTAATHRWVDEERSTTLPFEMVDDHIVLPVSVNGSAPLNFVLDSGAAATVIFESRNTQALPLKLGAELPVSGVGVGPNPVARVVEKPTSQWAARAWKACRLSIFHWPRCPSLRISTKCILMALSARPFLSAL